MSVVVLADKRISKSGADEIAGRAILLDFLKGWLISLVVFRHVIQFVHYGGQEPPWEDQVFRTLTMIHMPLFAMISGYFGRKSIAKRSGFSATIRRNLLIILPIFTIMMFSKGVHWVSIGYPNPVAFLRDVVGSSLFSVWYLWALVICDTFYFALSRYRLDKLWVSASLYGLFLMVPDHWLLHYVKFIFPFYSFGYFLAKFGFIPTAKVPVKVIIGFGLAWGVALIYWSPEAYIYTTKMRINPETIFPIIIRNLGGFGGGVVFFLILRKIFLSTSNWICWKVVAYVGSQSLVVYLLHMHLLFWFVELPLLPRSYPLDICIALLVVAGCVLLGRLLNLNPLLSLIFLGKRVQSNRLLSTSSEPKPKTITGAIS